jgi:hypothetical protein
MPEKDPLNLLIDSALSTYADPGPGLDQRILSRIATQTAPKPRRRWLPWVIALPVAACLLILLVPSPHKPAPAPSGLANQARPLQQPPVTIASRPALGPASPTSGKIRVPQPQPVALAANPAALPKLDVFPTPQPLTPQEQALAICIRKAPASELQALIQAQKQDEQLLLASNKPHPLDPPVPNGN